MVGRRERKTDEEIIVGIRVLTDELISRGTPFQLTAAVADRLIVSWHGNTIEIQGLCEELKRKHANHLSGN